MALAPDDERQEAESDVPTGFASVADRYVVDPETPLPELDSATAKAYLARDRQDPEHRLFALVCTPGLPARGSVMRTLRGVTERGILPLVDWDATYWPPFEQWTLVVVFERPMGGRVSDVYGSKDTRINEYDLPRRIVEPVSAALRALTGLGVVHRNVRPNNLFYMDKEHKELVLGECVTSPAGYDQPAVFETVPRGMANPAGRGEGALVDDLYALGVTVAFLLLGRNPVRKLKTDAMLAAKIELGTYGTLCGREKIPVSLIELLRGLLSDSLEERWGLNEVEMWLGGLRQTPMQRKPAHKAEIPFRFGNREHLTARTLGHAFTKDVPEAAIKIRDGSLESWLRRNLKMPELADKIGLIVEAANANASGPQTNDLALVARISAMLDPEGPVRYRGMAFMMDGFGPALAFQYIFKNDVQIPAEVISRNVPSVWIEACVAAGIKLIGTGDDRSFAQLRAFLQSPDPGYGLERCLYELNPLVHCQSPLVVKDFVVNIDDLLPALEEAAKYVSSKAKPMDRHLAAFIAARFKDDVGAHLKAIASPREDQSVLGILSLLAFLQWRMKTDALYGVASWLGGLLGPAITTYHSRATRREIERDLPRLVRKGSLPELFDLIDNAEKRKRDTDGYARAVSEFTLAEREIRDIEENDEARQANAIKTGRQAAAMISLVLAMVVVCVLFFMQNY